MSEGAKGDAVELALAAEFPAASREQWLALVSGVLKGAPFERRLVSKTYDGLSIEPLYARDTAARPVPGRNAEPAWQVMQRIEHPDPATANAQARHDLEGGATGLSLVFGGAVGSYGFGLPHDEGAIARILDDVVLDAGIALDIEPAAADFNAVARRLTDIVRARKYRPDAVGIRFGFDSIGVAAASGDGAMLRDAIATDFAEVVQSLVEQGYRGPFAVADARVIHNAGGSEAQELGFALAGALSYLTTLEACGFALDDARRMIYFRLAADADQFLTTAKFRALRKLWARVEEACGLEPRPAFIAAETAWRMMTRRDPYVNMLRATMAVVAAGIGGADAVAVVPHTAAIGLPDGFARRIARNTQLILLEESSLARVADPAAGSGAFESLTRELCDAAWSLFQAVEKAGGVAKALERGLIQEQVAAVRAAREKAIAQRKDALTGTSEFPDLAEIPAEVLAPFPPISAPSPLVGEGRGGGSSASGATVPHLPTPTPNPSPAEPRYSEGSATQNGDPSRQQPTWVWGGETKRFAALPCRRLAEPFEALRDASDRHLAKTGARPKIFLANLGRLADLTARANYAKNFFEAGGIEAVTNDGFAGSAEMIAAFKSSGLRLACLCSSDEVYAAEAAEAASALGAAGAVRIYLAGRPAQLEASLTSAGVDTFVHVGCDALATLVAAHALIGLA
jgi:methylmalonyl-CoA mutase